MRRVLVTGGSGFLGRRLLRRLAEETDDALYAVSSRPGCRDLPPGVSVETADLLDAASVAGLMERIRPEACIHLAWEQREEQYRNSHSNYQWLAASILLFSEFQKNGGRQFLFAGSSGEYEDRIDGMTELPPSAPMSLYGRCKKAASELFLSAAPGMHVQVARCFTLYGPGDTHRFGAIPCAICTLLRGGTFSCQAPEAFRDYIYIDDAVEALMRLFCSGYRGALNIGSGIPRPMREVFGEIAGQLGCPERVSCGSGTDSRSVLFADTARMREVLQMEAQTDFHTGIAKSIAYWRAQLGAETVEA